MSDPVKHIVKDYQLLKQAFDPKASEFHSNVRPELKKVVYEDELYVMVALVGWTDRHEDRL